MLTLAFAPGELAAAAGNRWVRRVHACEHATVNVLEEWLGRLPHVSGLATKEGFYLWGAENVPPAVLYRAAQEGLLRMKRGESGLAIHERCGSSVLTARLVFAVAFLATLTLTGYLSLFTVLTAVLVSWFAARPAGRLAQRYLTTSADVDHVALLRMAWDPQPRPRGVGGLLPVARGARVRAGS
jgi:hypothetical protein